MKYLEVKDFTNKIRNNVIQDITGKQQISATDELLVYAENKAINVAKMYIDMSYDTEYLLNLKGLDRKDTFTDIISSLTIYFLFMRNTHDVIPETRQTDYQNTIQMLKDIRDFKIQVDFPRKNPTFEKTTDNIYHTPSNTIFDWDF